MMQNYTNFYEMLREIIDNSELTIYGLSMYSGVNRTTLQKALSGTRILSEEHFAKIYPFLQLTPTESDTLTKLYQIQKIGSSAYYKCEYIKNLLENLTTEYKCTTTFHSDPNLIPKELTLPYSCKEVYPILNLIYQLAYDSICNMSSLDIYLFAPFDDSFITDILSLFDADMLKTAHITHLIPFIKNTKDNEASPLHNIKMLSYILPFYLQHPNTYTVKYYYEETSLSNTHILFPYYLIISDYVMLLSSDYQNAILLDNKAADYYKQSFLKNINYGTALFLSKHNLFVSGNFAALFTPESYKKYRYNLQTNASISSEIFIVNNENFVLRENMCIFLTPKDIWIILFTKTGTKILAIRETSILLAFSEFFKHGTELHYMCPKNSTEITNTESIP